ncbi:hypothetical protein H0H93_007924 [Arthromyces matolae]|nr:hypothetical protein H0H93_007924 [Arthromyces matolae]
MPLTRTSSNRNASENTRIDELVVASRTSSSTKRKRLETAKAKANIFGDVIEISSDDDDVASQPKVDTTVQDLRRHVKRMKEQMSQLKDKLATSASELSSVKQELTDLKAKTTRSRGKVATLDWFETTRKQFKAIHPGLNDAPDNNYQLWTRMMQNPLILQTPHAAAIYAQLQQQYPEPQYTCPTCRVQVKTRPVEDFALKSLIRVVAVAAGESSPKKAEKHVRGKGRAIQLDPWETFFPKGT